MRTALFIVTIFLIVSATPSSGGYRSLEEFKANTPSIPAVWSLKTVENPAAEQGEYVELTHVDSLTGSQRDWNRFRDGKVWGYVSDSVFYYNYRGTLSRVNTFAIESDTVWFYGLQEMESGDFNTGNEDREWHEDLFILDLTNEKVRFVLPRDLKRILRSDPELLDEYKQEDDSYGVIPEYLERYFERQ